MTRRILSSMVGFAVLLAASMSASHPAVHADAGSCIDSSDCSQAVLQILNSDRAHFHRQALSLQLVQSRGTATCVGSVGHSLAMAVTDSVWHTRVSQPKASFPKNICVHYRFVGENVGYYRSGDQYQDLVNMNALMMAEPHDRTTCATIINHACSILSKKFHRVGIGIYFSGGATWLTEDFTN